MPEFPRTTLCVELPNVGQVAYFVDLHLDTVREDNPHPHCQGTWVYYAEGMPRPMYVLAAPKKSERGRRWFVVLPITTKGPDERGATRRNLLHIGECIDPGKDSFLRLEPKRMPENMLHPMNGRSPVCGPCDERGFQNVVKLVAHWAMGGTIAKVFGGGRE